MGNRHVVHTERGWRVKKENAQRPSASADTQAEAVQRAIEIVGNDGGGQVIVHDESGAIHATHDVDAGGSATKQPTVAAEKAAEATATVRDEVADTTERTERQTESLASAAQSRVESAASVAAHGARQLGSQAGDAIGGTVRRFGGLVRAVGSRAAHTLESTRKLIRRKGSGKG